ncbi:MAG: hypothetical protein U5O39_16250 [Gammaproteobacteria bacterium]|nr:hypothetical protein [Gammaproteobacteria bacterium]
MIGAESTKWGETPVAIVVAQGAGLDAASLINWCNERVGKQQRIRDVQFVNELPRNPNGKILKRELRADFAGLSYD